MKTAIIIPTFNTKDLTLQTCVSVRQYSTTDYRLLVVDNGSTDGTAGVVMSEFLSESVVLRLDENTGFAGACNAGAKACPEAEVLIFLNSDVLLTPGWDSRLCDPLMLLNQTVHDGPQRECMGATGPTSNFVAGKQRVRPDLQPQQLLQQHEAMVAEHGTRTWDADILIGFCLAVRRDCWADVGGFDERFKEGNSDDIDWCYRAKKKGWRLAIVPSVYIYHFGGATFQANGMNYGEILKRNRRQLNEKWGTAMETDWYAGTI